MRTRQARGYTLVELVVVVGIIGLIAMVAVPQTSSNDPHRLAIATAEFADAIRFSRAETLRTGVPHGFKLAAGQRILTVFRVEDTGITKKPVYDVRHPISKQLYVVDMENHPFADASAITPAQKFRGTCVSPDSIYFDASGTSRCFNPSNTLLLQMNLKLQLGPDASFVYLDGLTGRVTIQ